MRILERHQSRDGITAKYVLQTQAERIETTYVDRYRKHIICFSTGVGCPMSCTFCCASDFQRHLQPREMTGQCQTIIEDQNLVDTDKPLLFSAMGEGDGLVSTEAAHSLLQAFQTLDQQVGLEHRFAVATTAVKPELVDLFGREAPTALKLQLSLHAPNEKLRRQLIPVGAPFEEVLAAGKRFARKRPGMLEWNYVLIEDFNDHDRDAHRLAQKLEEGVQVKLNRLNPIPGADLKPSSRVETFRAILESYGLETEYYETDGVDIAAACGQLKSNRSDQPDLVELGKSENLLERVQRPSSG